VPRGISKAINRRIRRFAQALGCDVRRANAMNVWEYRVSRLLNDHGIRTVLDVGANEGQYASVLLDNGFRGSIISFEPLPAAWRRLKNRAASVGPRWIVADRVALGDRNGEAEFYQAGNSVSSSLLPMTRGHLAAAPESFLLQKIKVGTQRLDDYLAKHTIDPPAFLKMDVQGAETLVLAGARNALRDLIAGVQLEMSLTALYEGQQLYWEADCFLRSAGFECCDLIPEFRNPDSLHLLQYDGIYFKNNAQAGPTSKDPPA
jgi:FkbM family methyltransferase